MADSTTVRVPALRARLIAVPFDELVFILSGAKRIANLPATGYIRTLQLNMKTTQLEIMVIDAGFEPLENLGDIKTVAAEVTKVVSSDVPKRKKGA
jgi:hypothetical protein